MAPATVVINSLFAAERLGEVGRGQSEDETYQLVLAVSSDNSPHTGLGICLWDVRDLPPPSSLPPHTWAVRCAAVTTLASSSSQSDTPAPSTHPGVQPASKDYNQDVDVMSVMRIRKHDSLHSNIWCSRDILYQLPHNILQRRKQIFVWSSTWLVSSLADIYLITCQPNKVETWNIRTLYLYF